MFPGESPLGACLPGFLLQALASWVRSGREGEGEGGRALPWIPSMGQGLAWWSSHLSHGAASPICLSVHLVGHWR